MAEFEGLMNDEEAEVPGEEEAEVEAGEEEVEMPMETEEVAEEALEESADLTAVKADTAEGTDNAKSPVAANAGAKGAQAKPAQSNGEEKSAPAPKVEDQAQTTKPDLKKV
jgi:hypothetical protein